MGPVGKEKIYLPLPPLGNYDVRFSKTSKCKAMELFPKPNNEEPEWIESDLDDATLYDWLNKPNELNLAEGKRQRPKFRLRILIIKLDYNTVKIALTEKSFRALEEHYKLHEHFLNYLKEPCALDLGFVHHSSKTWKIASQEFFFRVPWGPAFFQLELTYNFKTTSTNAILFINNRSKPQILSALRSGRSWLVQFAFSPFSLPLLLVENRLYQLSIRNHRVARELGNILEMTGQADSAYFAQIKADPRDPLDLDFPFITREINGNNDSLAWLAKNIKDMLYILGIILSQSYPDSAQPSAYTRTMFTDKIEYLRERCRARLSELDYNQKRAQMLIQAVYQFMAQKDTKINTKLAESSADIAKAGKEDSTAMRTIAIESKKDSSAMKAIAILGMLFLPGTFIAAIFAMPVLDFTTNEYPTIKPSFVYYWAFTLPLTFLVFFSWASAQLLPWRSWLPAWMGKEKRVVMDVEMAGLRPGSSVDGEGGGRGSRSSASSFEDAVGYRKAELKFEV